MATVLEGLASNTWFFTSSFFRTGSSGEWMSSESSGTAGGLYLKRTGIRLNAASEMSPSLLEAEGMPPLPLLSRLTSEPSAAPAAIHAGPCSGSVGRGARTVDTTGDDDSSFSDAGGGGVAPAASGELAAEPAAVEAADESASASATTSRRRIGAMALLEARGCGRTVMPAVGCGAARVTLVESKSSAE